MAKKNMTRILGCILITAVLLCACSGGKKASPYDAKEYIRQSDMTPEGEDIEKAASEKPDENNFFSELSVPTYITKVDDTYFIVDCYHNLIIYSDSIDVPLNEWKIMCRDVTQPHTLASDGIVYLVDDTENNRVLIFEKSDDKFVNTQVIYDIGVRPHFSVYDKASDTFYVLSSETGEIYCFRHTRDSSRMYLTDIRKVERLSEVYVRSFSIIDGDIYFVSGVSSSGYAPEILQCDLETMEVKNTYPVPDNLAGMVQLNYIEGRYYITVSTDITGNQDFATLIRCDSLSGLSEGKYEDIYEEYFIGGGTPYNISGIEGTYYLTEHRLKDHSIWSFKVDKDKIYDVKTVY